MLVGHTACTKFQINELLHIVVRYGEYLTIYENFSLLQNVQTGSESHPASYLIGTELFSEGKAAGA